MSDMKVLVSTNILPVEIKDIPSIMKGDKGEKGLDGRDGSYVQKAYKTYASMLADKDNIPTNTNVVVNNDPDKDKNAYYTYDGSEFTKSDFDPQGILTTVDVRLNQAVESASEYFQSQVADTIDTAIDNSTVAYTDAIRVTKGLLVSEAKLETKEALNTVIENGGLPAKPFATKALMTASALADGQYAMVTDDTANNGLYVKTAGSWVKSAYDPVSQAVTQAGADARNYTDEVSTNHPLLVTGKNLFDKSKVIPDYNLSVAGVPIVSAGNNLSGFIRVKPDTAYSFTSVGSAVFYDANKTFLSRTSGAVENVISPATAKFVRVVAFGTAVDIAQVEEGTTRTIYAPYNQTIPGGVVGNSSIQEGSISGEKLQDMSVPPSKLMGVKWLNMHDRTKLVKNKSLALPSGEVVDNASFDLSELIPCKPLTQYIVNSFTRVAFYDENKVLLGLGAESPFTTPEECVYIRFSVSNLVSHRLQVNEGNILPSIVPQPHKYSLTNLMSSTTYADIAEGRKRLYSFTDAWVAWKNKEKFPIAFMGDSTTEGTGTSGGTTRPTGQGLGYDYIRPNSYSAVFQALIREATGNTVMRAYNAGFLGTLAGYGLDNFDEIFGSAYSDVKMIGLSYGINDRKADALMYKQVFLPKMEALIKKCLDRGIQPFILTTQPVTIPFFGISGAGTDVAEIANTYKMDLANKYNLEVIDVNKYGELFMQYSDKPLLNTIMENNSNIIHFGDAGHKFTAELIFAHFCKRVIWTYNDGERLDYSTQKMESRLSYENLEQYATAKNGFKLGVTKTQSTATDLLYQDFYVFNAGRKQLDLTAYYANAAVGQYVEVDDVQSTITTQGQELGTLDLGLHKIKAYSSATTTLDWLGFKLTPTT